MNPHLHPSESLPSSADVPLNGGKGLARFTSYARKNLYLGGVLGLGSPLGLLGIRYYWDHRLSVNRWIYFELVEHGSYYIYAGVGTVLAMALWGVWSGRKVDVQRGRAQALERAALRLRDMADTDGLTGVHVRRHLLEKLDEELRRAERYKYPVASLFVDVDNFKAFNEAHGHMVGDEVLRRIAQVTRASVRETDIVGRYGGDEFLVMLPHANAREAFSAAERIRKGVEKLTVTSKMGAAVPVTVSVGMIAAVPHEADVLRFLEIADQALHRSKGLGKNCTILCDVPATVPGAPLPKEKKS
ncbi:MAG: GGDEF domain-containing protein [Elusimicrobia bacterium]|nr:GGDEF domain-containing protein [Elusimicrobiota bacterium]